MRGKQKAKFRVGQVVCCGDLPNGDYFMKIVEVSTEPNPSTNCFEYSDNTDWFQEIELRPLTAREIGPRPRGKGRK